jgi:hypothetical protein
MKRALVIAAVAAAASAGSGIAAADTGDQVTAAKTIPTSTNGRVAVVPVDYTCSPQSPAVRTLSAHLRQLPVVNPKAPPEHQHVALLQGETRDVTCDGNQHHADVVVRIMDGPNTLPHLQAGPVDVSVVLSAYGGGTNDTHHTLANGGGQGVIVKDKTVDRK